VGKLIINDCTFLSLIPLPRGGDRGHSQITAQIRNDQKKGLTWENEIRDAIQSILDGVAPSEGWSSQNQEAFETYAESIEQVRDLIKKFLKHDTMFLAELKLNL